ncbi:MAG: zinc-dependent peptidase [Bacteroidetes bacterium]|nr:zinc-dependent peptidase [Rhodothermia bacterium]MCS7154912.1 zinc-dependent peptidase [Bacteroidota bacterium]MCX7906929.1 zinc-dependent peptidase [Bacteroidota bacterium]MDW8137707.1 zinc-dependent peptidase [Bacteroidota bacterium]MDW8285339.1 zinc-dependent peptidase [Bacteroidota bacterium]
MRYRWLLWRTQLGFHGTLLSLLVGGIAALGWLSGWTALYGLALATALLYGGWLYRRWFRLKRALARPFPARWRALLERIPLYAGLGEEERARFETLVLLFLAEHRFEGVDGIEPTDEQRLLVAAGGAALLLGRPYWSLPRTPTILFYPGPFDEQFQVRSRAPLLGQVYGQGPVLLSLPAVESEWFQRDGQNVVLHELAHLLDLDGQEADGVPRHLERTSIGRWRALLAEVRQRVREGRSPLRPYAATHPAECFAVSVEAFFEIPHSLAAAHPEWYAALAAYFNVDPRQWLGSESEPDPIWNM